MRVFVAAIPFALVLALLSSPAEAGRMALSRTRPPSSASVLVYVLEATSPLAEISGTHPIPGVPQILASRSTTIENT
jgi:hypothetical protein